MALKLRILGCNSAIPSISRFTTAQVLHSKKKNYIIDCGEGIQIRLNDYKVKKGKISEIFISHLHGDHFFGLPGLLTSFNLSGRIQPLTIYGPKGLKEYISTLKNIGSFFLNYELHITELDADKHQIIHEDEEIEVYQFPLKHRVPTTGFLFKERIKPRKINSDIIEANDLSFEEIQNLKNRKDVIRKNGTVLEFKSLTFEPESPASYAFCSDTVYDEDLLDYISNVDLLYHEATYLNDLKDKSRERMHSTASEAAKIAKLANVSRLVLGHFSSRYKDTSAFLDEAKLYFNDTELAIDGKIFIIE